MLYPASRCQPDVLAVICRCHNIGLLSRQGTTKFLPAHFAAPLIPRTFETRACSVSRAFGRGAEELGGVAT
jgi:hypothetical protein